MINYDSAPCKNLNAHIGYTKRNMYWYFHDH